MSPRILVINAKTFFCSCFTDRNIYEICSHSHWRKKSMIYKKMDRLHKIGRFVSGDHSRDRLAFYRVNLHDSAGCCWYRLS